MFLTLFPWNNFPRAKPASWKCCKNFDTYPRQIWKHRRWKNSCKFHLRENISKIFSDRCLVFSNRCFAYENISYLFSCAKDLFFFAGTFCERKDPLIFLYVWITALKVSCLLNLQKTALFRIEIFCFPKDGVFRGLKRETIHKVFLRQFRDIVNKFNFREL